jgi:hypothetical protein
MSPRSSNELARANTADLMFVNISHPEDIRRQRGVQTHIRQHVMKTAGHSRQRVSVREKKPAVAPTVAKSIVNNGTVTREAWELAATSPGRSLAPLGSFPIEGDMRVLELVRFCKIALLLA